MDFAQRTIELARRNVAEGGRPFATVIVKGGEILAESANQVAQTHDPTAHAEILAIRQACTKLGSENLIGATIYVLAHPCPMCLGSLYYCSPDEVVFLTARDGYEPYYVDDRKYLQSLEVRFRQTCSFALICASSLVSAPLAPSQLALHRLVCADRRD